MTDYKPVYLDNNASTAPDPVVVQAVADALSNLSANASSDHGAGRLAREAVELARAKVATLCGASTRCVTFTSGATEANQLAFVSLWEGSRSLAPHRTRIVVAATEHQSVFDAARRLERLGAQVSVLPVKSSGVVDVDRLRQIVDVRTLLVSVMAANNETGVQAPLVAIGEICHAAGAYFHSDATQALGRIPFSFESLGADLVSLSAHKFHGPKGVGALLVRSGTPLLPTHLGGQEHGLRAGTLNTPGIVGLGVAAELASSRLTEAIGIAEYRDHLETLVAQLVPSIEVNGASAPRLPNTSNIRFLGADGEAVMSSMPDIYCSTGSACTSGLPTPSHVLVAMGLSAEAAHECLRFSLSRHTRDEDLRHAAAQIAQAVAYVRAELEGAAQ